MLVRVLPVCLVALLGLAASPVPRIQFTDTRLKNGLRLIVSEEHAAPMFSIVVNYNVGSRDEARSLLGEALQRFAVQPGDALAVQARRLCEQGGFVAVAPDFTIWGEVRAEDGSEAPPPIAHLPPGSQVERVTADGASSSAG